MRTRGTFTGVVHTSQQPGEDYLYEHASRPKPDECDLPLRVSIRSVLVNRAVPDQPQEPVTCYKLWSSWRADFARCVRGVDGARSH